MIKIYNDFLNDKEIKSIANMMLQNDFGWFYYDRTSLDDAVTNDKVKETYQFSHLFFDEDNGINSDYYEKSKAVLDKSKINYDKIIRIKANFTTNLTSLTKNMYQPIHQDQLNGYSFLYYVNDSDGDTLFFDDNDNIVERYRPKAGTGVLFNSNIKHCGQNPIKNEKRLVINYLIQ